jgi:hypothetical protein
MQLWNDYEGRTIAEAYPLKKLVRPEGRSAFFLTTNGTGTPSMVRLIEAHYDEPEILARWRMVSEIDQENLVAMRKYGEAELDGTPLVYAVMEPTEMSLAELLQNRTLTVDEAKQLASSLIRALTALHAHGLVHEHVEPANILAAGETIKLRSDCVREANSPDDEAESTRRKAADAQNVAAVLLEAMTGRRTLQGSATLLPPPFDGIIRNGLSGKWGLSEMAAALGPVASAQTPAPTPRPIAAKEEPKKADIAAPTTRSSETVKAAAPAAGPLFESAEKAKIPAAPSPSDMKAPAAAIPASRVVPPAQAPDVRHRIVKPVEKDPRKTQLLVVAGLVALLLIFVGWRMMRSSEGPSPVEKTHATTSASQPAPAPRAATPPPTAPAAVASAPEAPLSGRTQWHVVAYTYNHQDQAQQKAAELKQRHPTFNPEVFSPTGRAPYLVTVGGAMTRDQAIALRRKARAAGLPRDTYARNYSR